MPTNHEVRTNFEKLINYIRGYRNDFEVYRQYNQEIAHRLERLDKIISGISKELSKLPTLGEKQSNLIKKMDMTKKIKKKVDEEVQALKKLEESLTSQDYIMLLASYQLNQNEKI